jgi:hypothetical protein
MTIYGINDIIGGSAGVGLINLSLEYKENQMQQSQVGRYLITALIVLVILILLALLLALGLPVGASAFLEMAWNWLLRLVGLTTVVFSIIALLAAGPASLELERFSKWIVLALLGLLIIQLKWFLTLGLVGLLITIMVVTYLRKEMEEVK